MAARGDDRFKGKCVAFGIHNDERCYKVRFL